MADISKIIKRLRDQGPSEADDDDLEIESGTAKRRKRKKPELDENDEEFYRPIPPVATTGTN